MSFINVLQLEVAKHFSIGIMSCSECRVSITRIQNFLESRELETKTLCLPITAKSAHDEEEDKIIMSLSNVFCNWYDHAIGNGTITLDGSETNSCEALQLNAIALSDISLELRRGSLTCIVGTVGSGKTALLLALAGELTESKGHIDRDYLSLTYAAQDPWIMNGTVKENIVMGRLPFDAHLYSDIVNACGLVHDFSRFPNGEETIVGDRGVQCSGGQRARIGLARALYRDADVVLLDDPLSAVDSKVGRTIFFSAILDLAVKRGKCVVLATHQHQFIGDSRCVLMSRGKIKAIASFAECVAVSDGKLHRVSYNAVHDDPQHDTLTPEHLGKGKKCEV